MLNPNIQAALKTDARFQALLKQEMNEHQKIIASHHKEMQTLRESLKHALERFTSLFNHVEQEVREKISRIDDMISVLSHKIHWNETSLSDQENTMKDFHEEIKDLYFIYAPREDLEKLENQIEQKIYQTTTQNINSFQDLQRETEEKLNSQYEIFSNFVAETTRKFKFFVEEFDTKLDQAHMDKDGVMKEIEVVKKNIFIAEKKIENLYTLIERMKKGEICHKLES